MMLSGSLAALTSRCGSTPTALVVLTLLASCAAVAGSSSPSPTSAPTSLPCAAIDVDVIDGAEEPLIEHNPFRATFQCKPGYKLSPPYSSFCVDSAWTEPSPGSCTQCEMGKFAPAGATTACTACQPGTYQASAGQEKCDVCERGFYCGGRTSNFILLDNPDALRKTCTGNRLLNSESTASQWSMTELMKDASYTDDATYGAAVEKQIEQLADKCKLLCSNTSSCTHAILRFDTAMPTSAPTTTPTSVPTTAPSTAPSAAPTQVPTSVPTSAPTAAPSMVPTTAPSTSPTQEPTHAPSNSRRRRLLTIT